MLCLWPGSLQSWCCHRAPILLAWPLTTLQMLRPKVHAECKHQSDFFLNYFSDQNYNICFTNSIWSVLLTPHIIPLWWDSLCTLLIVQKCCSPDYCVPSTVTVMFSLADADASSGHVNSNHITALNMMFTPKFTQTRILRTRAASVLFTLETKLSHFNHNSD